MDKQKKKKQSSKNMMYEQQLCRLPTGSVDKLVERIEDSLAPVKYAVIIHDKDVRKDGTPVEPHVHAMLHFRNERSWKNVAKLLGDKVQQVAYWDNREANGFAYLIHATRGSLGKFQYSPDDVIANFDYKAELEESTSQVSKTKKKQESTIPFLLDALYDGTLTKADLEKRLSGSQIGRYSRQIETVWSKRLQKLAAEFRQEMIKQGKTVKTMWIYGPTETGKTSLAREYAEKTGHEIFVSGSSRDIFQDYIGQHTVILDELRPGNLAYSDLLRITDPYGRDASAPSRYYDKVLAVEYVIITSPYNPFEFYLETFAQCKDRTKMDGFGQLLRRLSVVIEMDPYTIKAVEYWDKHDKFREISNTTRNNPYSAFGRHVTDAKENAVKIYNSIFDDLTAEEVPKENPK